MKTEYDQLCDKKCATCVYWQVGPYPHAGRCDIALPPWLNIPDTQSRATRADESCAFHRNKGMVE